MEGRNGEKFRKYGEDNRRLFSWAHICIQGEPSPLGPALGCLWFWLFHCLPDSAWADESLAEWVDQLIKTVGISKLSRGVTKFVTYPKGKRHGTSTRAKASLGLLYLHTKFRVSIAPPWPRRGTCSTLTWSWTP